MRAIATFLGTAGYAGLVPVAPGTAGSVVGVVVLLGVRWMSGAWSEAVVLAVVLLLGVWASGEVERHAGRRDPGAVVIDEVAGVLVTLFWLPVGWVGLVAGFVAFRVFDITKPFPAAAAERLAGGWGIMADDVVAGLYAHLTVRLLAWLMPALVLA